ncbi:MAG: radical SAM protein [Myxococcales bacterium]
MASDPRQLTLSCCAGSARRFGGGADRHPPPAGPDDPAVQAGPHRHGGTEFVEVACRSVLNWVQGTRMSDFYSANPYRGCQFGCLYCYARYTHEYLGLEGAGEGPESFERKVFVKVNAPEAFARDLKKACHVFEAGVHLGSATDPYQPAEARFGVTRRMLEKLVPLRGLSMTIATKSVLAARDTDLLAELSRRHALKVVMTCVTLDRRLQRELEPLAPPTEQRLDTLARLSEKGVKVGLLLAPVMPGLNDGEEELLALCRRARQAGAQTLISQVLFLPQASQKAFLPWLQASAPALHRRYVQALRGGRQLQGPLRTAAEGRLARARAAAGLGSTSD